MNVLGIETSCDETAVAVVQDGSVVRSNLLVSQAGLHHRYGGVVPELASRQHLEVIVPLTQTALERAGLAKEELDAVAVTCGPGLIGALAIGVAFAKSFAYAIHRPLVGVNHLEGHLLSIFLDRPSLSPPFVALVASGGHTNLYHVEAIGVYRLLGRTRDDAAGEAFDKAAKLLGLGYPGGPIIDQLADHGDPGWIEFPRGMWNHPTLEFSFSGLKTALVRYVSRHGLPTEKTLPHVAASFQAAIVDVLVRKSLQAVELCGLSDVVVVGGVAANRALRRSLQSAATTRGYRVHFPPPAYCTDNGAMIAVAGFHRLRLEPPADLALGPMVEMACGASVTG
jgi:N6-L-threonylcarbamoyladenine synthase